MIFKKMKIEKKIGTAVARRANELHSYNLPSSETQGGGGTTKVSTVLENSRRLFCRLEHSTHYSGGSQAGHSSIGIKTKLRILL